MNAKLDNALTTITNTIDSLTAAKARVIDTIKKLLAPCGEGGCLIGTEDYCDDIFYVRAEPEPNKIQFITEIRCMDEQLEVRLATRKGGELIPGEWMPFMQAHIEDMIFLLEEISNNLEYSDGYQDE